MLIDRTEVRYDAFVDAQAQKVQQEERGATGLAVAAPKSTTVMRSCSRLTVDIADLCLERLPQFQRAARSMAIGKHLCGVAADMTLRCYVRAVAAQTGASVGDQSSVGGRLALALCCHHLCQWEGYADTNWLAKHGIGPGEFALMKRLATKYRAHPCRQRGPNRELPSTTGAHLAAARASCGIMAKRCLNEGRAAWLRAQPGWGNGSVRLVRYVGEAESPENFLLLGMYARE